MQQNHPVETRQIPSTNALIYWTNHIYSKKPILPPLWLMQSYCKKITESDIVYLEIIFLGTNLKSWAISILFFCSTIKTKKESFRHTVCNICRFKWFWWNYPSNTTANFDFLIPDLKSTPILLQAAILRNFNDDCSLPYEIPPMYRAISY